MLQSYYEGPNKVHGALMVEVATSRMPHLVFSATAARSQPRTNTSSSYKGVSTLSGHEMMRRCYACDKLGHVGTLCPELRVRSVFERVNFIMDKGNCVNCLSCRHHTAQCPSEQRYQVCKKKHRTMLHFESTGDEK